MATETIKGKLTKKAGNGKGFQLEDQEGWFNANDKVEPFLAKIEIGKTVEVSYFKKGVKREVTLIKETGGTTSTTTEPPKEKTEDTGKYENCTVCGKELKNKNYPTCWTCKEKAPKVEPGKERAFVPSSDKDVQIQRGNSLNSASAVLKGNFEGTNTDIETIKQATLNLAEAFLDWLRAE